jgi:hypothetical protein
LSLEHGEAGRDFEATNSSGSINYLEMNSDQIVRLKNRFVAYWKWCLSFRKRDWELKDYPVMIREKKFDPHFKNPRFTQHRYVAHMANMAIMGGGDTAEDALQDLRVRFEAHKVKCKAEGQALMRPGRSVQIEFASQDLISGNHELSDDFIQKVLNLDWAWISDESSLWDFHTDETNELFYSKIVEVYGVDVSDIESAKLWEIFNRIAAAGWPAQARIEDRE